MPPAVLTLECAKKVREVLGDTYKTELAYIKYSTHTKASKPRKGMHIRQGVEPICYAPDLAETIRLLPKIAEKKEWLKNADNKTLAYLLLIVETYMKAPTPEQGMIEISEYILKIL